MRISDWSSDVCSSDLVVTALCRKYGLWLVEDCCDALGSTYRGKKVGTFGDIGTLSFYPAHHITMGEGGAVFTNDPQLKRIAESFRSEQRRVGKECVRTGRSRGSPYHDKKTKMK